MCDDAIGRALRTLDDNELAAVLHMSDGMFSHGPGPCERLEELQLAMVVAAAIEQERRCLLIRRATEVVEGRWETG